LVSATTGGFAEVTARVQSNHFPTDIGCRLLPPPQSNISDTTLNYRIETYYNNNDLVPDFIPKNSSNLNQVKEDIFGQFGSFKNLDNDFTQKVRSARRRSSFWRVRVDNYPTLLLIFASEKYFNDALDDSSMLSIPANTNKDTKIQGMYIITENGVKTIEDCQNKKQIDNYYKYYYKADFSSLTELLQHCNYDYNACHCDTNGQKLPIDEPRCGNVTNCRAGRDRPGGYICEKCSSVTKMGDHCDKSVMTFGLLSISIISATSLLGALFAPFQKSEYYPDIQGCMIAVAVGCLTGDAILHLIPIIFGLHGHSHGKKGGETESHAGGMAPQLVIQRGIMIMGGLYVFYLFETLLGLYQKFKTEREIEKSEHPTPNRGARSRSQRQSESCAQTGLHHLAILDEPKETECYDEDCETNLENGPHGSAGEHWINEKADSLEKREKFDEPLLSGHGHAHGHGFGGHGHSHGGHGHSHGLDGIAMVGWMVILGDGLHNFADGLAIGAAFSASYSIGLGTVLAVFFHELPHEMGDFAVLLGSGMNVKQAMFWNLVSSFTCFIGFFGGVYLSNEEEVGVWILGIAAGAFIYIALVDMLPEIRIHNNSENILRRFLFHQIGLISGGIIMWVMAKYEEDLIHAFQS